MRKFQGSKNDVDVGRSFSQSFFFSLVIIIIHKNQRGCTAIYLLFRYIFLKSWWWETRRKDERAQTFSVFIASQFQLVPTVGITPPPRVQFLADFHAVQVSKFVCCCFSIPLCSWDQRVMLCTRFLPPPFVRFLVCAPRLSVSCQRDGRTPGANCRHHRRCMSHTADTTTAAKREKENSFLKLLSHTVVVVKVFSSPPKKKKTMGSTGNVRVNWYHKALGAEPITSGN
jgi:hypothetical protein